jgi:hypothetical protein
MQKMQKEVDVMAVSTYITWTKPLKRSEKHRLRKLMERLKKNGEVY